MPFQPNGVIYLIGGVLIDKSYEHTYDFDNSAQQLSYFQSKVVFPLENSVYVRKDHTLVVEKYVDDLWNVNYVLYKNNNGKWIYNFINSKNYVNEDYTELILETDVLQTYMFDFQIKPSFIDREHMNRWNGAGSPILHYVDENIGYGDEYIKTHDYEVTDFYVGPHLYFFLVVSTEPLEDENYDPEPLQNCPTPYHYYLIPFDINGVTPMFGGEYVMDGQIFGQVLGAKESIISFSFLPYLPFRLDYDGEVLADIGNHINLVTYSYGGTAPYYLIKIDGSETPNGTRALDSVGKYEGKSLPSTFGTGISRNYLYESKLLTFPYYYYLLNDYQCNPLVVKNEYLEDEAIEIHTTQVLSHNLKTKYFIPNYKGDSQGKLNCVINATVNDLPLISDAYANYILQNKNSIQSGLAVSAAGAGFAIGGALATGGLALIAGTAIAITGVSQIVREIAKQKDLKNIPDSVRSAGNNIQFDIADGNTKVHLTRFELTETYRKILGDYFSLYGYKCNEVKVPNLKSRYYYNFIKMIGANITGNIENSDLIKIKEIFNNGITFWHYHASGFTPLNYTYENIETSLL